MHIINEISSWPTILIAQCCDTALLKHFGKGRSFVRGRSQLDPKNNNKPLFVYQIRIRTQNIHGHYNYSGMKMSCEQVVVR